MTQGSPDISQLSDEQLLEQYRKAPSRATMTAIFNRHLTSVFGVCMKYLKGEAEAKDAAMDIFEMLLEKLKTEEVKYFRSWLYMVTKNHCLQVIRKQKGMNAQDGAVEMDPDRFMESDANFHLNEKTDKEQEFAWLDECLEGLKNEQQQCVRLFFLKELCYKQIVAQTGYAMSKVKSYIQNGKRNLKICLESKHEQRLA